MLHIIAADQKANQAELSLCEECCGLPLQSYIIWGSAAAPPRAVCFFLRVCVFFLLGGGKGRGKYII